MKRWLHILIISVWLFAIAAPVGAQDPGTVVLARIDLDGPPQTLTLPIYAHLQDVAGQAYVLVIAPAAQLVRSGRAYQILDTSQANPQLATRNSQLLLVLPRRLEARAQVAQLVPILHDDGRRLIARATPAQAEVLAALGCDIAWLPDAPLALTAPVSPTGAFSYNPYVAAMITQVQQATVYTYTGQLSGVWPTTVGGAAYTIATRHTNSGVPIQKATQWAYEHLQGLGMTVSYHTWTSGGYSNRNVVAEKPGVQTPDEIVLITAHIDDMPSGSLAPGADDNGSGSIGVLLAAEIMSQYSFARTVRFVFFTGEEQGLYGSSAYADDVYAAGDNIVAVYNMDMIAWDSTGGPTLRLHTRTTGNPGYPGDLAIAGVFTNVVSTYNLSPYLTPIIDADGEWASDHSSFWDKGYSAILAIEDDVNDFNDYYHTVNDRLDTLDMTYYTHYVKASVGTAAHLARPLGAVGTLQGNITVVGGDPLADARIQARSITQTFTTHSNSLGAYSLVLPATTYTVIAQAYGYLPSSTDVTIPEGATVYRNFVLTHAPTHTLTGTVTAADGWPLYAHITVTGDPFDPPASEAETWTDPYRGVFTLTLPEGITYTLHAAAWVPGYTPAQATLAPLTGDTRRDFTLAADLAQCSAPGYTWNFAIQQDFEANNGGYTHSGTQDEWEWGDPVTWPTDCASGTRCWGTDLDGNYNANASQALLSPEIDLSAVSPGDSIVVVWSQAWAIENAQYDHAYAELSINGGEWKPMWTHTGDTTQVDWTRMTYDLSAAAGGTARFRWRLTSDGGEEYAGYYIDAVAITGSCTARPGGLAVGHVNDANTGVSLNGATVSHGDNTATTSNTPTEDALYALFIPTGTQTLTAMHAQYGVVTAATTISPGDLWAQDFALPAGILAYDAPPLTAVLALGMTRTLPLTLANHGTWPLTWAFSEQPAANWLSASATGGSLAAGAQTLLTLTLETSRIPRAGTYTTRLRFTENTPYAAPPELPVTLTVIAADLDVSLSLPIAALAGDLITGSVSYTNTGAVTATAATLSVALPPSLTAAAPLTWTLGDLAPHVSGVRTFTATLAAGLQDGDILLIQAEVHSPTPEFNTANNVRQRMLLVASPPSAVFSSSTPDWLTEATVFTNTTTGTEPITYGWSFGDGATSALAAPTHVYTATGTYTVTLTAVSEWGQDVATETVAILLPPPPTAAFVAPATATAGVSVGFTNTSAGFGSLSYAWDFGDTMTSTLAAPTHVYTAAGTYTVTLTVTNLGGSDVATATIAVRWLPPVAAFTSSSPDLLGETTLFTNTTTGIDVTYHWDLGDGVTSTLPAPTHIYTAAGTYTTTLTAVNASGTDVATGTVVIVEPPCEPASNAAFTFTPLMPTLTTLNLGVPVTFTGVASGTPPILYAWEFGDRTTGSGNPIAHTYLLTGTFTVTMTAINACGGVTVTDTLTIFGPPSEWSHKLYLPLVMKP